MAESSESMGKSSWSSESPSVEAGKGVSLPEGVTSISETEYEDE